MNDASERVSGQANAMAQYMVVLNSQELGRTCWATRSSVGSFARTTLTFACFTLPGRPRPPTYVLLFLVMCTRLCTPLFWLVGPLVSRLVSNSFVCFYGIFQAVFPSLPLPIRLQLILTCIWPSSPCSSRALQKKDLSSLLIITFLACCQKAIRGQRYPSPLLYC